MSEKSLNLPKSSVKRIMKINHEVNNISAESVIAVSKTTELFLSELAKKSHQIAVSNGRKIIKIDDIITAISNNPKQLEFLDEAFQNPKK